MITREASGNQKEWEIPLNVLSEDDQDSIDGLLLKIYERHIDLISLYARTIQIAQMIVYISTVFSMILLAIRLSPLSSFRYSYVLIPGLIAIFALMLTMNIYLLMKDLIDSAQKRQEEASINSGTVISYLCLNMIGISGIIFVCLILTRLDSLIHSRLMTIFIPLFFGCCTALFFVIFISPAFIEKKLYFEIAVMFIDIICVVAFGLLLAIRIDNDYKFSFGLVVISLHFALGIHAISLLIGLIMKKVNMVSSILILVSIVFFFITVLLFQLKQDKMMANDSNWIEVVLGLIGFNCLFAESIYSLFFEQDSPEERN